MVSDAHGQHVTECPACSGSDVRQAGDAAAGFDTDLGGRHFYQPAYTVLECAACGLYFKSMTLTSAQLDEYYAALDGATFDIDAGFPTDRVLHRRLRSLPKGSRVLDFGCSTGRILKDLTTHLECVGVEPNQPAAAIARDRGIEIITTEQLSTDNRRFDAILLTDVFEHLAQPMPLLTLLASRLSPGGWLAIVTGNADAIEPRRRLAEWWYLRLPGHLIMLGERHLSWLASQLRLRLDEVQRCSHYQLAIAERVRQRVQGFAYDAFKDAPSGAIARVLRRLPGLSRARHWPSAPALTYRADHVVAFLTHGTGQDLRSRDA
jgi:SAM-dependent methyltransferase